MKYFSNPSFLAANANTTAQAEAIVTAVIGEQSGAVLQLSQTVMRSGGGISLVRLIHSLKDANPSASITLHLDHGLDYDVCVEAMDLGFDSVMMDGSYKPDGVTPRSYAENVDVTSRVVEAAHARGVAVEGALGLVGSLISCLGHMEDDYTPVGPFPQDAFLTDVDLAKDFVSKTGVDALAIAIGTTHGPAKFEAEPSFEDLDLDRISQLRAALPGTLLVMHGSSSVSADLQDEINAFGGSIKKGWGMPVAVIQEAIRRGVGKVNVDTDLRLAMTAGMRRYMAEHPEETNPRLIEDAGKDAVTRLCRQKIRDFNEAFAKGPLTDPK